MINPIPADEYIYENENARIIMKKSYPENSNQKRYCDNRKNGNSNI